MAQKMCAGTYRGYGVWSLIKLRLLCEARNACLTRSGGRAGWLVSGTSLGLPFGPGPQQ